MEQDLWTNLVDVRDVKLRQLASRLPQNLEASREKSTIKAYNSAFRRFKIWVQGFIELSYLPASSKSVSLYVLALIQQGKSYSVVKLAICAISWFHRMSDLVDVTKTNMVQIVVEGAKRLVSDVIIKKEPMTVEILLAIRNYLLRPDGSMNLLNQRNLTFCILAFAGFFRYSEVSHIRRNHIEFHDAYLTIFIPSSKTDVYHQGKVSVIAKTGNELCPVANLSRYLIAAGIDSDSEKYIFRAVNFCKSENDYKIKSSDCSLSYSTVQDTIKDLLRKIGLDAVKFGVHSLRSGGATAAAASGVSDRLFKRHGRWKSDLAKDGYVKPYLSEQLQVTLGLGL